MNITLTVVPPPDAGLDAVFDGIADAAAAGFTRAWVPQLPPVTEMTGWDALTALAVAGSRTPDIELGSSIAVVYGQHPFVLARQALTAAAATGGRFILGIGVSHKFVVTDALGYSYDAPVAYLREYLEVLGPALAGLPVEHHGPQITAVGQLKFPVEAPRIVLAALGPRMLGLAGRFADGVLTAWTGPKVVEREIIPQLTDAAAEAGRPVPQVIVGLPVSITDDVEATRAEVNSTFSVAREVPRYRAMVEKEGVNSIADLCLVGDESEVMRGLKRFADLGVDEFSALPVGDNAARARTVASLREIALATV
ncbi:TIGR03564 family F420-dependent LLM class oxidoreductase [Mycolicibacterium sp. BiH015]|uniref:TIGR03564 family F420-dependent LLM class oxidoreductase n=1 Tax=Mycolicibacterium sp. BiH015 TaxID=3018808 RepID=UPI0022E456C7|nr:TIGR03564 family F420-dependent LLM class oxidoreductase [Mycolicibacterium sp. BiH015]MDA2890188.1 TIGR03564 family F420-dependent LLM class oxidoreductase [Mycolicibacterium sp. BiH015]